MTFRELWLKEAEQSKGIKRARMLRIAKNPKAMRLIEQRARERAGLSANGDLKAVDWQKILPIIMELLPILLKLFAL